MTKEEYLEAYRNLAGDREGQKEIHHRYYLQFATSYMYHYLQTRFDNWGHTEDEHMNDIPLKWWNDLPDVINKNPRSPSDKVCTYKAVARDILNQRNINE